MTTLTFNVHGIPGAQGSKTAKGTRPTKNGGRAPVLVESSAKVAPWRSDVHAAAVQAIQHRVEWGGPIDGPVEVSIAFRFLRPKTHYGTGRNADVVKASAPEWPTGKNLGDLDKLMRSSFDALTAAGVVSDDSRIVSARTLKRWCRPGEAQGAAFRIVTLTLEEEAVA